jgi:intracellular septation protein
MTQLLDLLPLGLFFAAYSLYDLYVATGVLIAASFALVLVQWLRTRKLPRVTLFTALAVGVFGGLTIWLRDPQFIKLKLTFIYAIFALALLGSQVVGARVLMARLGSATITLPEPVWRRVNFAWALFFLLCAGLNLYVADNFSEAVWVKFKVFGVTALMFAFILLHAPFLARYLPDDEPN